MIRQNKIVTLISIFILVLISNIHAGNHEEETGKQRLAQITFISPLGTNGIHSATTTNNISLNIFMGVSGGVNGFEFGGFHNTTKGDMKGLQVAGFGNVSTGISSGVQFGGFYNVDLNLTTGVQIAGITNVIHGPSKGAHFGGISNYVTNESWAFQASGIANVTPGGNHGLQVAGISNVNGKEGEGSQIAGIANVNYGKTSKFQAAGIINVAANGMNGAQIAGILNYTKKLSGFQLALINYADTLDKGVPLGLISIVKNGYYAFELEANDAFWINATYKMGVPKLYNIWTVGFKQENGNQMWGVGLGLGSILPVGKKWGLNFDLTATHVNENEWWTEELNLLNRLKFNAWFDLGPFQIFGGPSLNVHVSNLKDNEGNPGGNLIDPELSLINETNGNTRTLVYPGFNFGIRF